MIQVVLKYLKSLGFLGLGFLLLFVAFKGVDFDDLIEEKIDSLYMWIKNNEKSNKTYHI